jgi:hypothetical protein
MRPPTSRAVFSDAKEYVVSKSLLQLEYKFVQKTHFQELQNPR